MLYMYNMKTCPKAKPPEIEISWHLKG